MGSEPARLRGVKYVSFYDASGYGIAAKRYLKGLLRAGVRLTWTPMVSGTGWGRSFGYESFEGRTVGEPELDRVCNLPVDYDTVIVHTVPEYFPVWAEKERGKKIIGYTVWETDRPPRHWPALLNGVDRVFVPCRWNREVFEGAGVTRPIDVVPHVLDDLPLPPTRGPGGDRPGDYVFYTIGTWTVRKALWNTIRCYLDTFRRDDPALLVVKTTDRDFTRRSWSRFLKSTAWSLQKIRREYRRPGRVRLITEYLTDEEMLGLHARGDCYISLCRSEGWGLGAFDAAGYGRPVIITGYGGQLDYLPEQLSYLVDYDLIPVDDPGARRSYSEDQSWAEPRLGSGSRWMRHVFEHREEAKKRSEQLQDHVRANFSAPVVIRKMMEILASI